MVHPQPLAARIRRPHPYFYLKKSPCPENVDGIVGQRTVNRVHRQYFEAVSTACRSHKPPAHLDHEAKMLTVKGLLSCTSAYKSRCESHPTLLRAAYDVYYFTAGPIT